jgi:Zn-dependent M16 (insulinase) family peptidase
LNADAPALSLLASVLTDRFLHREIREKGGAYGGGASHSATDGYFSFSSYRDPNCAQTLDAFRASIEWICDGSKPAISQRELDEALLSVFSDFDRPVRFSV